MVNFRSNDIKLDDKNRCVDDHTKTDDLKSTQNKMNVDSWRPHHFYQS